MGWRSTTAGLLGAGLVVSGLAGASGVAGAQPSKKSDEKAPVVKIKGGGSQVKLSTEKVHPGAVQFKVHKDFKGSAGIVATDDIDKVISTIPDLGSQDPTVAAQAVTALKRAGTMYSGAGPNGIWQADLGKGTYFVVSFNDASKGKKVVAKLTVKGQPSGAELPDTGLDIIAKKPNVFEVKSADNQNGWVGWHNKSSELHFAELDGVKQNTTNKDVKKALKSPEEPDFLKGKNYFMDVISPGVDVAFKGEVKPARYVVVCFMPSQVDGMPHALMGMWKLADIG